MVSSWRRTLAATASRLRRSWSICTASPDKVVASRPRVRCYSTTCAQARPPVEGGPADPGAVGYFPERDGLPGRGEFGAGGLDLGLLVVVSWHGHE